ncbi:hypothetical protein BS78_03G164300 [Paspalum vaginatum]|nr:hypothetical protein BS78_03G164300 [Paspalum vaginatum]
MARSPAEEEEDASTGPGGWPRRPRYAVGDEVEVILTEKGFRGARFEATVTARLPGSGDYEVVYSDLVEYRGGPPLLEVVSAANVRLRPPPPPPERDIDMFDLVEAYRNNGWWPGVVSGILPKRRQKQQTRFAVSLPLFREVLEVSASLVRPRREFVCGSWMDAQEVLRGIPLYPEGSSVEVMSDKEKKGTAWRPATIVKMVGGTNYIVNYGNENSYIEVLHSCFIRPQPSAELMLEHEMGPSAKVEVYHDGIWSLGVIADAVSCEPRRYRVMIQQHNNAYGDDCLHVSSAFLRPYSKRDSQEWRLRSTKKHARKRNYSNSDYSVESTPGGNSDQYSSISNKRMRKEELHLRHSLNLRQDTARSSVKDAMDMEISSEKHISRVMKLESETGGLAFRVAKEKDQILEGNSLEKLIYTRCDGKGTHALPKVLASKRKDLFCASSHGDTIEISSKTDVVVISDDSGYGNFIEISDGSSYKPKRKKTRMNLTIGHSNHLIHDNQAQHSASNLWDGAQEIRLPGCQVKELLGNDETDEQQLSDHLLIENVLMALDDSAGVGENYEMSAKVTEVISCVAGTCNEEADAGLTSPKNSNQKTVDQSYSGAFSIGKLEPSSCRQHDVEGDLICIESPNGNKAVIKDERTSVSSKEAALPIGKLEPSSSEQQDVKADLLCIQASMISKWR